MTNMSTMGTPASPELRYFLYLDTDLVREFLAQLEEGEFESYELEHSGESSSEGNARLGIGAFGVSGQRTESALDRARYSMRLTPASQFARLVRLGRTAGWLKEGVGGLANSSKGDLALVSGTVDLTGITRLALGFRELDRSERLFGRSAIKRRPTRMEALSDLIDKKLRRGTQWSHHLQMARELEGNEVPTMIRPFDTDTQMLVRLQRKHLRVEPTRVIGEARVLVKIGRVLKPGEQLEAAELFPGAPRMGEGFRQGLQASNASVSLLGPMQLSYPGFVGTALAIYEP